MGGEKGFKGILSSGNDEIDKKFGDGIPLGSLVLIEGENDTGKSVLCQQMVYGAVHQFHRVAYYSTENSIRDLLAQTESLNLDISDFYSWGYLKIFSVHLEGIEWTTEQMKGTLHLLATHIKKIKERVIIIDSLTMFTIYATEDNIFELLITLKNLCKKGYTIFFTLHQHAFKEDTLVRARAACDCHLSLRKEHLTDRYICVMEVAKIRGAKKNTDNIISFEVQPGYGIRIIPVSEAKV